MGRKSLYTKDIPKKVEQWCREGLIEKQITAKIGISVCSFEVWKNKYPELVEALKAGKQRIDNEVENSLLKRALGYDYEETTTIAKNVGHEVRTEVHKSKKQIIPDVTAQIFWLKNRRPEDWRDKQEISQNIKIDTESLSKLPTDELIKRSKAVKEIERKKTI